MKQIQNCPICNHNSFNEELSCIDHTYSKEPFSISSCKKCSFWFTNPIPEENVIGDYYKSEEYVSHTNTKKGLINILYHWVKKHSINKKYLLVSPFLIENNTLMDFGCGAGDFLSFCKSKGADVSGFEPSEDARNIAEKTSGLALKHTSQIHDEKNRFDVITMWHVLEHVYNLNTDFSQLVSLLNDNGRLIVAVPNRESYDALTYKEDWAAYDLPRHLYHFTKRDISTFAENHHLEVEKTIPMIFDSFYVSMLSEKYKGGNFISGIVKGFVSNLKARKSAPNHSSLIYVLKKRK